ncbi:MULTISPECIES: GntR family transcriptional regulator [Marinomonas]|uniref:GntR family transcriptional regulator n=1 Tax=Marinomonas arctica TaxID=383750 RepID=A0A7H1J6D4_9GAMM|nr:MULTISPECIES: GntR family transcriptional regulator [Marinomonas]MCS7485036.1 GntR family transcriptional regulator [Marinomonas sp. BSi20414]QNT06050.1 GntR family transcriptional regulator [Marinomonas arctica]GGN19309.1 GntR family transcriptional regulator [Marinomonas arctica]
MADFLYKGVVDWFLDQMSQEAIVPGDKMPSLRALSKQLGLSLNTVIHGYELLSEDGWIESRPKSGYFVCHRSDTKPALLLAGDELRELANDGTKPAWSCLAHRAALVDQSDAFLSPAARQEEVHLPVLGKGHLAVREAVSEHLKGLGIKVHASHLWLGHSPLAIFTQTVQTLTQRGDSVLVLTPCDPRITTTLQSLGRQVIALTAGERGVDLDLAIRCLRDKAIRLIVLPGQFSFPAGQLVSNLSLRRWLAIIEETKLPVIEWDLCSHLAYRAGSMMTYKSMDSSDHIVYIGGVESKGVDRSASWCLPGRYQAVLEGAFLGADMALSDAQQMALNDALQPNSKRSLTKRAREVWANSERVKAHLETRLGEHVSFAASKGGMSLWMRLSKPLDVASMTALLAGFRHAIVPGALVSHEADANHWLAVNVTLDDVEPLAKALAEHLVVDEEIKTTKTVNDPVIELKTESAEVSEQTEEAEEIAEAIESDLQMFDVLEANNVGASDKEAKKSRNATTEPLYNPMLDLINHDFG